MPKTKGMGVLIKLASGSNKRLSSVLYGRIVYTFAYAWYDVPILLLLVKFSFFALQAIERLCFFHTTYRLKCRDKPFSTVLS